MKCMQKVRTRIRCMLKYKKVYRQKYIIWRNSEKKRHYCKKVGTENTLQPKVQLMFCKKKKKVVNARSSQQFLKRSLPKNPSWQVNHPSDYYNHFHKLQWQLSGDTLQKFAIIFIFTAGNNLNNFNKFTHSLERRIS